MPSPFPGMDPYLENPVTWPDLHSSLIAGFRRVLKPILRPKYVAHIEERFTSRKRTFRVASLLVTTVRIVETGAGGPSRESVLGANDVETVGARPWSVNDAAMPSE